MSADAPDDAVGEEVAEQVFSTRADGDFALDGTDDVLARRRAVLAAGPWTWLDQVHGATVVVVDRPGAHAGSAADAAVTSVPGAVLAVHTADCAPVLLHAPHDRVIGAAHVGWRGLVGGVLEATVAAMGRLGAGRATATVGPHIRARCYEFGADDLDVVASRYGPGVRAETAWGTPALDLLGGIRSALEALGVEVLDHGGCTACEPGRFHSHRARSRHRPPGVDHRAPFRDDRPDMTSDASDDRGAARVTAGLERVLDEVASAGGDPGAITVVAVTKGFPVDVPRAAAAAGLLDVGESYAQELRAKADTIAAKDGPTPRWHFIGRLQSNKVRLVADVVSLWQSVDRTSLVDELAARTPGARILVQVDAAGDPSKGGADPAEVPSLVASARDAGLVVDGLMAVGVAEDEAATEAAFTSVARLADRLDLEVRSMGMSGDIPAAVRAGTTMLRVGTALFGPRPPR